MNVSRKQTSNVNLDRRDLLKCGMQGIRRCYIEWFLRPRGLWVFLKGMNSWENIVKMIRLSVSHLTIRKSDDSCGRC